VAKKKCPDCPAGAPLWMTTYGDMITLMLCFFIALLAFSSISEGKFQEVASGITRIFSGKPPSVLMGGKTTVSDPIITTNPGIKEDVLKIIQDKDVKGKISVQETDMGTVISLGDMQYFEPFSAKLTADAKILLEKIGAIIVEHTTNVIEVYGFTDDRTPPDGSIYPSNWHLSSARSASVVKYFMDDLKTKRIAERIVDIRNGKFDPDYYYDAQRFYPIGRSDVPILEEISRLDSSYKVKIELLDYRLKDEEINKNQYNEEMSTFQSTYKEELQNVRNSFQKIEILVKKEKAR